MKQTILMLLEMLSGLMISTQLTLEVVVMKIVSPTSLFHWLFDVEMMTTSYFFDSYSQIAIPRIVPLAVCVWLFRDAVKRLG